jgi:hypothetical protein
MCNRPTRLNKTGIWKNVEQFLNEQAEISTFFENAGNLQITQNITQVLHKVIRIPQEPICWSFPKYLNIGYLHQIFGWLKM